MAELNNGPLGGISGKLGNMVASNWRDISYLRAKGKRSKNDPTDKQKIVREKFKMMFDFLIQIKRIVELGFKNKYTGRSTAYHHAVKKNMAAFKGTYPDLEIDLALIEISAGYLLPCSGPEMVPDAEGDLTVKWDDQGSIENQEPSDEATVVLYSEEKKLHAVYVGAQRSELEMLVTLPKSFSGDTVHGYIFFTDVTGKLNSKSIYMGSVKIP
ncbi:DUF6266 family protein [Desertivirga xinjiangensis]|uniref:DUF6266 family protein n=1 Tax=Desertivirga xinjiangensis TaxID=539206 RepID=UPI002108ACA6|nr:DUF6266 family protein [Pedobacter xinjiangensis]